jgi:hypothetical protein
MGKFSYFKLGVFIISAVIIGILSVVALGPAQFSKPNHRWSYIGDDSVAGSDVSSPVRFAAYYWAVTRMR